jgi:hypothetical protein
MKVIKRTLHVDVKPGPGRVIKYPFGSIGPGQCLEVEVEDHEDPRKVCSRVSAAFRNFRKRNDLHWLTKVVQHRDENGKVVVHAHRLQTP